MVKRIAQDITDKVHSAVSSSIDDGTKEKGGDNGNRWNVIEEGIKSMSAATKQMVDNQVMMNASSPERNAYFSMVQSSAMLDAGLKKKKPELETQKMELESQKIELQQIKIQAELKALQNERSNRDGETVKKMAVETVENDVLFAGKCNFPDCEFLNGNLEPEKCVKCATSLLHHCCQVLWESNHGLTNQACLKICFIRSENFFEVMNKSTKSTQSC